jgi:hypothetical protein
MYKEIEPKMDELRKELLLFADKMIENGKKYILTENIYVHDLYYDDKLGIVDFLIKMNNGFGKMMVQVFIKKVTALMGMNI